MTSIASKADYVRAKAAEAAKDPHNHTCHWPGCTKRVAPAMWGCYPHGALADAAAIPGRNRIWAAFKETPGQEISKTMPSREYIEVAREVDLESGPQGAALRERAALCRRNGWTYDL
jgi:hypothetical protein